VTGAPGAAEAAAQVTKDKAEAKEKAAEKKAKAEARRKAAAKKKLLEQARAAQEARGVARRARQAPVEGVSGPACLGPAAARPGRMVCDPWPVPTSRLGSRPPCVAGSSHGCATRGGTSACPVTPATAPLSARASSPASRSRARSRRSAGPP